MPVAGGAEERHGSTDSAPINRYGSPRALTSRQGVCDLRYVTRRFAEGKTKREIMRILKRYIAREVSKTLPRN